MTTELGRISLLLLKESFGDIVSDVGRYLTKYGPCTLADIFKGTNLEKEQVSFNHVLGSKFFISSLSLGAKVSLCAHPAPTGNSEDSREAVCCVQVGCRLCPVAPPISTLGAPG